VDLPLLGADAMDPVGLAEVTAANRVVISTTGLFPRYGEPLGAARAEAGIDDVRSSWT
jgi:short subunit dehydrogenase-like uncharacterized protein